LHEEGEKEWQRGKNQVNLFCRQKRYYLFEERLIFDGVSKFINYFLDIKIHPIG
jgi:hypothetical protein